MKNVKKTVPEKIKVGTAVVIMDADNKILLGKRQNILGDGEWVLPGGHMKLGETLFECAKREVYNEVGVVIQDIGFLETSEIVNTGLDYQLVEIGYACNRWEGIVQLKEHKYCSEWKFFDIDRLPKNIFAPHAVFVDNVAKRLRGEDETDEHVESLLTTIHPYFKIGVETFVLDNQNRLLMGLRCDDFDGGNWAVPGGHLDVGETLAECALRELWEESGVKAEIAQQFGYVEQPINISNKHYFHFGFLIKDFDASDLKIGESEDFTEWKWFDLNQVPPNLAPSQREMIIKFLKYMNIHFGKK